MEDVRDPRYRLTMRSTAAVLTIVMLTASAAAETNHCEISVTGDTNATIKADAPASTGKLGASTDYWLTEAQLRMALSALQGIGKKLTREEKQRKVDEAMKKDPRFMLLIINCMTDEGGVMFSAASNSKYADVPLKPASYAVVPNRKARPGELTTMFHLVRGGKHESYSVSEPGKLSLTQFDRKGIAGTFSFKAEQRGKVPGRVTVTGTFKYHCLGEGCQK
jgi:hypothetical protein